MGWSLAAACGVQGRGILRGFPHSLSIRILANSDDPDPLAFLYLSVAKQSQPEHPGDHGDQPPTNFLSNDKLAHHIWSL